MQQFPFFGDGHHMIEMYLKNDLSNDRPVYVGMSALDLGKLCLLDSHGNTVHTNFKTTNNLSYSDTDSLVYSIQHNDIHDWIKQHKHHFDLSDSMNKLKTTTTTQNARTKARRTEPSTHDGMLSTEPDGIFREPPTAQRIQRGEKQNQ